MFGFFLKFKRVKRPDATCAGGKCQYTACRHWRTHEGKYSITIGEYNKVVGEPFKLPHDPDSAAILIISTPNMFDVSFKRWFLMKCKELGSVEAVAENVSSPIQEFLEYRLEPLCRKFDALSVEYELLHDYSLWANRKPKILMQTCGHVSGES
ncbi:hypothetical protein Y032_0066g3765 [Ancylostoma ceylanicum]|uniref:Cyanocobalamin reductase (cyanide-eliminating) n=1 Tax=Ancylostoma ceylanicum TaxID=53326 RepID=A0A016U0Q6_9BILA|nr:hypothetical protein Y032_0066g3765 [Ancylostoma ceylanicum]